MAAAEVEAVAADRSLHSCCCSCSHSWPRVRVTTSLNNVTVTHTGGGPGHLLCALRLAQDQERINAGPPVVLHPRTCRIHEAVEHLRHSRSAITTADRHCPGEAGHAHSSAALPHQQTNAADEDL